MSRTIPVALSIIVAILGALPERAEAVRLKDLTTIKGFRSNSLVGVGIVVGLNGTGDNARSPVTRRSLYQMFKRLGMTIPANEIKARNVAAVAVTAKLPPFARAGMTIDVTISSIGSARSLQGGTLLATPLRAANLRTFAIAQGSVSLGGFAVQAKSGSSAKKNHNTVARISDGATVERSAPLFVPRGIVELMLKRPDFTTASRIAKAIDKAFGAKIASVRDAGAVKVRVGTRWRGQIVHFIAALETVEAKPDAPAMVVIDQRSGTVVVGQHVRLTRAAIAHGGITVKIEETPAVSQPGVLSRGKTKVTPRSKIVVKEKKGLLRNLGPAVNVGEVAAALNALSVKPRDLISIFQALHAAGALQATIKVL